MERSQTLFEPELNLTPIPFHSITTRGIPISYSNKKNKAPDKERGEGGGI